MHLQQITTWEPRCTLRPGFLFPFHFSLLCLGNRKWSSFSFSIFVETWLKTFSPQWGKLGNDSVLIGAGEWVVRFPNCQKQVGWGTWLVGGFGLGRTMARSKNCSSGCPDPQEGSEWGSTVGLRCSCKQPWSHPPPCTGHYLLLLSLLIHVELICLLVQVLYSMCCL